MYQKRASKPRLPLHSPSGEPKHRRPDPLCLGGHESSRGELLGYGGQFTDRRTSTSTTNRESYFPRKQKVNNATGKPLAQHPTGDAVYHNNTNCTEGNNIEKYYLAPGTGGKRLCSHCAHLNALGK